MFTQGHTHGETVTEFRAGGLTFSLFEHQVYSSKGGSGSGTNNTLDDWSAGRSVLFRRRPKETELSSAAAAAAAAMTLSVGRREGVLHTMQGA